MNFFDTIARELAIGSKQAKAVADLLDEGATIPFIARKRKDSHSSLAQLTIPAVRRRLAQ